MAKTNDSFGNQAPMTNLPLHPGARALLLIAKRPTPGQTKTRLTPSLTVEQASALYECFLRDTIDVVRAVPGVTRFINYLPIEADGYFGDLAPDFDLLPQVGDHLVLQRDF